MRTMSGALLGVFMLSVPVLAGENLAVPLSGDREVDFGQPVATFYIANPSVVDARALDTRRVMLLGRSAGVSDVVAYDASGARVYERRVHVGLRARGPRSPGDSLIVQNGSVRTAYACSQSRCTAHQAQP